MTWSEQLALAFPIDCEELPATLDAALPAANSYNV